MALNIEKVVVELGITQTLISTRYTVCVLSHLQSDSCLVISHP